MQLTFNFEGKLAIAVFYTIRVFILYAYGTYHTIGVYEYGSTIRVWYGLLYHMRIVFLLDLHGWAYNYC